MYLFRSNENMETWHTLLQFDCQSMLIGEFFPGFFYRLANGLANENVNVLASSLNLVMSWQVLLIGDVNHNQLFFPWFFCANILRDKMVSASVSIPHIFGHFYPRRDPLQDIRPISKQVKALQLVSDSSFDIT